MLNPATAARRALPSVDRLLKLGEVERLVQAYGRALVLEVLRALLDELRHGQAEESAAIVEQAEIVTRCVRRLREMTAPSLKPVFNLTGTVLHTNLGRALMSEAAAQAALAAMTRPVNLEFDLRSGKRGERDHHVAAWVKRLTGADSAVVVNNNAAAVYLVLNTLGIRREIVVSRGELVEIGGAFRIPDIMSRAGCRLREVGTTNRTHAQDYVDAIGPRTAALMKVHTSNYAVQGFTTAVSEKECAEIAHSRQLPFIVDLGSGTLADLERFGLPHEPTPREAIAHGADLVTFSGDKLLGGPQCGMIVGNENLIAKIRRNPMKRALRVDKVTLAALEATLATYGDPDRATRDLPTLRLLTRTRGDIEACAQRLLPPIMAATGTVAQCEVFECMSQIGSGALPIDALPSAGIKITPLTRRKGAAAEALATAFRKLPVPVIGRVSDGAFILDMRCLEDEAPFASQLRDLDLKGVSR